MTLNKNNNLVFDATMTIIMRMYVIFIKGKRIIRPNYAVVVGNTTKENIKVLCGPVTLD